MEISIHELKQLLELAQTDVASEVTPCHDFDWDDLLPEGWRFSFCTESHDMMILDQEGAIIVCRESKQACIVQALHYCARFLTSKDAETFPRPQFTSPYRGVTIEYERDVTHNAAHFAFTRRDAPRVSRSVMVRVESGGERMRNTDAFDTAVAAIDRRGGFDAVARNREPGEEMYTLIVRSDDALQHYANTKNASVE